MTALPAYLDLKLKTTVERVTEAARAKGLEMALAFELFDLSQHVEEVFSLQDADLAKKALEQEHRLLSHIESLSGKPRVTLQRVGSSTLQRH